jgi:nicotinamide mononucleotide adenylyltransferase
MPHKGHRYLFETKINQGIPVLIAIRDVPTDEKNPFTAVEVERMLHKEFFDHLISGMMKIIVIPDIIAICYGREVGYSIEHIEAPEEIKSISATQLRKEAGL